MKREPSGVVLYVEDNRVNFLLVEQLLMIWSMVELHHAEDGARASPPSSREGCLTTPPMGSREGWSLPPSW